LGIVTPDLSPDTWEFDLYIIGQTRRSTLAQENLRLFCDTYLNGKYRINVHDLVTHPELTIENKICVTPMLIKRRPSPERMLVGDLSDTHKVLESLDLGSPEKRLARDRTYSDGLSKQVLATKWRHEQQPQ
jgi:circadian clock protein KaiB